MGSSDPLDCPGSEGGGGTEDSQPWVEISKTHRPLAVGALETSPLYLPDQDGGQSRRYRAVGRSHLMTPCCTGGSRAKGSNGVAMSRNLSLESEIRKRVIAVVDAAAAAAAVAAAGGAVERSGSDRVVLLQRRVGTPGR